MKEHEKFFRKCRNTKCEVDISSYKRKGKVNIFQKLTKRKKKIHHEFWKTVKKNYLVKSGNSGHAKNFNIDEKSLTILQKCQMVLLAIIPQL